MRPALTVVPVCCRALSLLLDLPVARRLQVAVVSAPGQEETLPVHPRWQRGLSSPSTPRPLCQRSRSRCPFPVSPARPASARLFHKRNWFPARPGRVTRPLLPGSSRRGVKLSGSRANGAFSRSFSNARARLTASRPPASVRHPSTILEGCVVHNLGSRKFRGSRRLTEKRTHIQSLSQSILQVDPAGFVGQIGPLRAITGLIHNR